MDFLENLHKVYMCLTIILIFHSEINIRFYETYNLIGNWQLETTFLALWTKIFLVFWMFFQILKQYHMDHLYARAHNSSYSIYFLKP